MPRLIVSIDNAVVKEVALVKARTTLGRRPYNDIVFDNLAVSGEHAALIINLPGQPKSIKETLEGVKDADGTQRIPGIFAAVPYCIDLIGGPYIETNPAVCKAFRPKSALRPAQQ